MRWDCQQFLFAISFWLSVPRKSLHPNFFFLSLSFFLCSRTSADISCKIPPASCVLIHFSNDRLLIDVLLNDLTERLKLTDDVHVISSLIMCIYVGRNVDVRESFALCISSEWLQMLRNARKCFLSQCESLTCEALNTYNATIPTIQEVKDSHVHLLKQVMSAVQFFSIVTKGT